MSGQNTERGTRVIQEISMKERRDFDKAAATWDEDPRRVKLAEDVAAAILREVALSKDMDALDFGCGTGLVTLRLQPYVRSITGADSSQGMLSVLERKVKEKGIPNVHTRFVEIDKAGRIEGKFHLVVSSMTLHHVPETAPLLRQMYDMLLPGGTICLADLDSEDGTFHPDNTGVFHFGFDRERLKALLSQTGFREIKASTAAQMLRESNKSFSVFLMTGRK